MSEFLHAKIFLLKDAHQIGLKSFIIKKVKNTVPWTYVINDLNSEKVIGTFYEEELQRTNRKEFRIEKELKEKVKNYMLNGKVMIILLIIGLIKKYLV